MSQSQVSLTGCSAWNPAIENSYGYKPSLAAGIVFCILFAIFALGHLFRFVQFFTASSLLLFIAALLEVLGWAARTWSSQCPYNKTAFLMQTTTLVIAPVFVAAAIYFILGHIIRLGNKIQTSPLKPRFYLVIFCICDIIALLVQAGGAGIAANEFNKPNHGDTKKGTNTVVGGIIFQLLSMSVFVIIMLIFITRTNKSGTPFSSAEKRVFVAIAISLICLYIRNIYRVVQLAQGFTGYLSRHQPYFIALDGVMLIIAIGIFNLLDPAVLLRRNRGSHEVHLAERHAPETMLS